MTLAPPPPAQTAQTGRMRVYVDGRHHWSSDLQQTLCGLQTSAEDRTKPGAVECRMCLDMAAQEQP